MKNVKRKLNWQKSLSMLKKLTNDDIFDIQIFILNEVYIMSKTSLLAFWEYFWDFMRCLTRWWCFYRHFLLLGFPWVSNQVYGKEAHPLTISDNFLLLWNIQNLEYIVHPKEVYQIMKQFQNIHADLLPKFICSLKIDIIITFKRNLFCSTNTFSKT